jgi:RNA recognition motif-containing protein
MNIYIGNLSYQTTETSIRSLFESYGAVNSVNIITDRDTGQTRGFGFVEMADDKEALAAIAAIDGNELDGRTLKVNQARPKEDRNSGPRGGGDRRPQRRGRW